MKRSRFLISVWLLSLLGVASSYAGMSIATPTYANGWCYVFYGLGTPAVGKIAYIKVTKPTGPSTTTTYTLAQAENVADYSQTAYLYADYPGTYTFYYEYSYTSQGVPRTLVSQQSFYIPPKPRDIRWDSIFFNPTAGPPGQSVSIQPSFTNTGGYDYASDYFIEYKDPNQTPLYYASINGVLQNNSATVSFTVQLPNLGSLNTATYHLRALQNNVTYFGTTLDVPVTVDYPPTTSLSVSSGTATVGGPPVAITSYSSDPYGNLINQAIDYLPPGGSWVTGAAVDGTRWDGSPTANNTLAKSFSFNATGTWQFRSRAQDTSGLYSPLQFQNVTVSAAVPPSIPYIQLATALTATSFTANWTASNPYSATGYRLDVSTSSTFSSYVSGYQDLDVGNVTSRSVTGLSSSATYYYRVRGYSSGGSSSSSGVASATTTAPAPSAPTATAASTIGVSGFTANWTASSPFPATSYRLDVSTSSTFASYVSGYQDLDVGSVLSRAVSGLASGTTYYYRIRGYSTTTGVGLSSNTVSVTTALAPPGTPAAGAATGITTSGFTANWSVGSGATSYKLDVSTSSGFGTYVSGYQNLDVGNVLSRTVSGLTSGTTYYYRVRASNSAGSSANSAVIAVTTGSGPANGNGPGLRGDYYNGMEFDSFNYTTNGENIDNDWGDNGDEYSVRWTGRVMPRYSENYTFITTSDDGVRLWVNGVLVIDNWTNHGSADDYSPAITLSAGVLYNIKMEFFEAGGDAVAKLAWQSASQSREAIPLNQLYLPGAAQTQVTSQNATAILGVPWSPQDVPGGYGGGSGTGRWEFAVSGQTNWGVTPWTPSVITSYPFHVLKRGDSAYDESVSVSYTVTVVAPLQVPTATAATNLTSTGFTANWTGVSGVTGYRVDVATDSAFTSYVSGYQNADAGAATTLSVSGLTASVTYYYRVRSYNGTVSSAHSNTISAAFIVVAPTITTQPQGGNAAPGTNFSFSVAADGTAPFNYQWLKGGVVISGATQATLTISGVVAADAGVYSVQVANSAGTVTSSTATLTVTTILIDLKIHRP
jgi:hypothetical protein